MAHPSTLLRWFVLALALLAGPLSGVATAQPAGKKYALLVGVRDHDSPRLAGLRYTENDVEELAEVLQNQGGFADIRLLTTSRGAKNRRHAPTAANIREALRDLMAKKRRHDLILVALAGHGMTLNVREGGREYDETFFCPSDGRIKDPKSLLGMRRLFADLGECGAGTKLLLVDASRNDLVGGRAVSANRLPPLPPGSAALFSCSAGERSFETPKLGMGHGIFFYHVIVGLFSRAKNDRGEVTWAHLVEYVSDQVAADVPKFIGAGAKQTPEMMAYLPGTSLVLSKAAR